MLCRHNKYVQEFGKVRDADEIARREKVWEEATEAIEQQTGHEIGSVKPAVFRKLLGEQIDLRAFRMKSTVNSRPSTVGA